MVILWAFSRKLVYRNSVALLTRTPTNRTSVYCGHDKRRQYMHEQVSLIDHRFSMSSYGQTISGLGQEHRFRSSANPHRAIREISNVINRVFTLKPLIYDPLGVNLATKRPGNLITSPRRLSREKGVSQRRSGWSFRPILQSTERLIPLLLHVGWGKNDAIISPISPGRFDGSYEMGRVLIAKDYFGTFNYFAEHFVFYSMKSERWEWRYEIYVRKFLKLSILRVSKDYHISCINWPV